MSSQHHLHLDNWALSRGLFGEAELFFQRAIGLLRHLLGDHHVDVVALQKVCANMLVASNQQLLAWCLRSTAQATESKEDLLSSCEGAFSSLGQSWPWRNAKGGELFSSIRRQISIRNSDT